MLAKLAGFLFETKMSSTSRRKKSFYCELCDVHFDFNSKYQRHLNSIGHRRYCSVQLQVGQAIPCLTENNEQQHDDSQDDYQVTSSSNCQYYKCMTISLSG